MSEQKGTATVHYIDVDTSKAEAELQALEVQAQITGEGVMRGLNKSYMALQLFLDIFHVALPQSIQLMAAGAMMAGQMLADLAAAEAATGILAFKAGLTFTMSAMLFYRGMILQQQASEIEQSINSTIHLLDLMTR